jgi:hypothetical protein
MLRTLALSVVFILIMAALTAGQWNPTFGPFLRELTPVAAFFLYFGLGYITSDKKSRLLTGGGVLVALSLVAHLFLYSTAFIVGHYEASSKLAVDMAKEKHSDVSYAEAAASLDLFVEKETGFRGIPGYAVYSERRSIAAANIKEYAGKQLEDVDDLGPLLAALLNILLYTIPITLKWLLTDTFEIVHEPGYIGLVFWYLVALGMFTFGFIQGGD